jgi:hypothetical protein
MPDAPVAVRRRSTEASSVETGTVVALGIDTTLHLVSSRCLRIALDRIGSHWIAVSFHTVLQHELIDGAVTRQRRYTDGQENHESLASANLACSRPFPMAL